MFDCLGPNSRKENFELRELLETTAVKNEDLRRLIEALTRDKEALQQSLDQVQTERHQALQEAKYLQQEVARLHAENEEVHQQAAAADDRSRQASEAQRQALERCDRLKSDCKSQRTALDRLSRENDHLKVRNRRMEKALAMLESLLDDTINETSPHGGLPDLTPAGLGRQQALRQSRDTLNQLKEWEQRMASGGGGTRHSPALDTVMSDSASGQSGTHDKDQRNGGEGEVESALVEVNLRY